MTKGKPFSAFFASQRETLQHATEMQDTNATIHPVTQLARRLGPFDATMIVMGGIIGSGIFVNPHVVATHVRSPLLILGAWILGGVIALLGAFIYAELSALRPETGGQYVYLRDAFGPGVAFLYGWALLLVIQSGGMAAVAMTFSRYLLSINGGGAGEAALAVAVLLILTMVNCLGVRSGATTQNALMLLKLAAIAMLVAAGVLSGDAPRLGTTGLGSSGWLAFGAAMTPVMFAYGGWQTASFISGELRHPRRDLVIGLLCGVGGVVAVYLAVNAVCLAVLGASGLASTPAPATAVMRLFLGERGATLIAIGIAISTAGFLSQSMLTAPRVYYAMAQDGVFFRAVAKVHPRTQVPMVAIALQGAVAIAIALSGTYGQILSYVVATDFIFFALTGIALFRLRTAHNGFHAPLHPWSTLLFVVACLAVVVATVIATPVNSAVGFALLLVGWVVYRVWKSRQKD
jgi:basic amino acid/polyamine antiporter, APA family